MSENYILSEEQKSYRWGLCYGEYQSQGYLLRRSSSDVLKANPLVQKATELYMIYLE